MTNRVRIIVTEDAIYVANTGRPIDRQGVISIARQYLSSKGETPPLDDFDCADEALADAIREKRLALYRQEPNDLKEHASQEVQTRRDYAGRSLWELLQNADDAMAPAGRPSNELIGAKGLGFKSVLEISERPEVHSGRFRFAFDADRSKDFLEEIIKDPPRLVFRLPHDVIPDQEVRRLRRLGYITVVKLPHKDEDSREMFQERLRSFPPHFILLSQHLCSFEARFTDGRSRLIQRNGGGLSAKAARAVLTIRENGSSRAEEWRVWSRVWPAPNTGEKRLSAAVAVRTDDPSWATTSEQIPLHVFYPTQESVKTSFLVHGSFELRSDRNHLLQGQHDDELISVIENLTREAVAYLPPSLVLHLFRQLANPIAANVKKLDKRIQRALSLSVNESLFVPVVGGGKVKPREARTWEHEFPSVLNQRKKAVRDARLCSPALSAQFPALRTYGAEQLTTDDYAELIGHVHCEGLEDCVRVAGLVAETCLSRSYLPTSTLKSLLAAPFWLTQEGNVRPLNGARPLVHTLPSVWPDWLQADELNQEFVRVVFRAGQSSKTWSPLVDGRLLRDPDEIIHGCLAPAVKHWTDRDWAERGWEFLELLLSWKTDLQFENMTPFVPQEDGEDVARTALAAIARVPCGSNWVLARDAYASSEIGGIQDLASFFRAHTGRSVVGMPSRARNLGRRRWRGLLRYLGVSWEPKIRKFDYYADGLTCESRYWRAVTETRLNYRSCDWFLDFFPECVEKVSSSGVVKILEALLPIASRLTAGYRKRSDSGQNHRPWPFRSCIDYQLHCERYLPCRSSITYPFQRGKPKDLYWPEQSIRGITPTLDIRGVPISKRPRLRGIFIEQLGVQGELPVSWGPWIGWAEDLASAVDSGELEVADRTIREFYERLLSRKFSAPPPRLIERVVSVTSEGLKAVPATDSIWIDDPIFAAPDIVDRLVQAGLAIFPAMLDLGDGSVSRLGARRATEIIELTPTFTEAPESESGRLARRVRRRRRALAAVCEKKQEQWKDPGPIHAVRGLVLTIAVAGRVVGTRASPAFKTGAGWLVNLDAEWDGLAVACSDGFRHASDLRHRFVAILKAGTAAEVATILLDDGIPTYRLREIALPGELSPDGEEEADVSLAAVRPDTDAALSRSTVAASGQAEHDFDADEKDRDDDEDSSAPSGTSREKADPSPGQQPCTGKPSDSDSSATPGLRKRPLYDESRSRASERGAGSGRIAAASAAAHAKARGLAAESWFGERLHETLLEGWYPEFNVRDEEIRESDVVLRASETEWHIEIKCLNSERIFWSQLEAEKAARLPGRYIMALLTPLKDNNYAVHWSWDPLHDLLACERRIEWLWSESGQGPRLLPYSWEPFEGLRRPERPPTRVTYAVQLNQSFLRGLDHDDRALTTMWSRVTAPIQNAAE